MEMLTKEKVLAAKDWKREAVTVEEWGGAVYVRSMSAGHYADYMSLVDKIKGDKTSEPEAVELAAFLASSCICDEVGNGLFSPDEMVDKSVESLIKIREVALRLSGLSEGSLEEKEGNSDGDPS